MTWSLPEPMLTAPVDSSGLPAGWAAEPKLWTGFGAVRCPCLNVRWGHRRGGPQIERRSSCWSRRQRPQWLIGECRPVSRDVREHARQPRRRRPHRRDYWRPGRELTGTRGNPDNLRQAAARKSAAAQARAGKGLREMIRRKQPITFRGLAQTADVSLDFLYRCTELRRRVEQLRDQQRSHPPRPAAQPPSSPSSSNGTATRFRPCGRPSKRPRARTSNFGAASAPGTLPAPRPPDIALVRRHGLSGAP